MIYPMGFQGYGVIRDGLDVLYAQLTRNLFAIASSCIILL